MAQRGVLGEIAAFSYHPGDMTGYRRASGADVASNHRTNEIEVISVEIDSGLQFSRKYGNVGRRERF
jgi:hypothetical protein